MQNLKNKKIVITGATGGIGRELAKLLVSEGANLFLISSNAEKLKQLKDELQTPEISINFSAFNLAKIEGIKDAASVLSELDAIDILINMSGISYFGSFGLQEFESIEKLYNINLLAPTILTQSILPEMVVRNSGQIVNIGSIFGSISFPYFATYSASKAGLRSFSEALRRELYETNIKVSYLAPRAVKTQINEGKVTEFLEKSKTAIDDASQVAQKILNDIKQQKKNSYFGFPEKFFVRLNYLTPSLVDNALQKQAQIAREILTNNN
jgi:short-subunit dehydrogenase